MAASDLAGSLASTLRTAPIAQRLKSKAFAAWRRTAISSSPYFDAAWYLDQNDDVRTSGADPLDHYLHDGERENRDPGPKFDAASYAVANPTAGGAALTHFLRRIAALPADAPAPRPVDVVDAGVPAIATGWLDTDWYRNTHVGPFDTVHPLAHYYRTGLDPSPAFDNADYEAQLRDAGIDESPLDHWVAAQVTAEHGPIRPHVAAHESAAHPAEGPLVRHRVRPRAELADVDIAVMIHAFYPDVLPALLAPLALLPSTPTLLISVTSNDDATTAHRLVDAVAGADQPRIVKVVPNRGRNFAPLLCSFDAELRERDIVLHLHTKKSLHSGDEQSDWRSHLVDSLLPSAPSVDAILSLLSDDHGVGVVQAPAWAPFPHWGNHWLGNAPLGARLYERLGVTDRRAHGYVMYPVGGMFWARVDALVPLLDLELSVGDFDREHGQTDRTLAHAIERTIPAAASVAGFDTVEFDPAAAQWRRNWSACNVADFGMIDFDALDTALESADLVSIDLFDTLLLRPCLDAAAFFDVLGAQLDALPDSRTPGPDVVQWRRDAESRLRDAGTIPGDVTLDEIYAEANLAHPDHPDALRRLERLELDLERRLAVPRTALIDHLLADRARSRRGRRYVLMTDTTQPLAAIESLLYRIGAHDLFDDLYVSNACRARKDSGTMWDLVQVLETPAPGRWLHLGDNEFSDIQQASDRGIATFHTPAPAAIPQSRGVDSAVLPAATRLGTQLVSGHGLAALAGRARPVAGASTIGTTSTGGAAAASEASEATVEQFGYDVLGPLTLGFVNWVTHTARDRGIDRLLFTARDGHLAFEVLRRIRPFLPETIPPADYFLMSRRVALAASLADGEAHRGRIDHVCAAGNFTGTFAEFLDARLGFRLPSPVGDRLAATALKLPDDTDWLLEQLEPFADRLTAHGRTELAGLRAYLRSLGIADGEHLGFVDLGYSGTTQKALTPLLDQALTGLYYVTTPGANSLGDAALSCFGRDALLGQSNLIYDNTWAFELLCAAPHQQLERFEFDRHGLRAVFDPRTATPTRLRGHAARAQAAAFDFVQDHLERFGPELLDERVDPATMIAVLAHSMDVIAPDLEDVLADLVIDDLFSGTEGQTLSGRAVRRQRRGIGPGLA